MSTKITFALVFFLIFLTVVLYVFSLNNKFNMENTPIKDLPYQLKHLDDGIVEKNSDESFIFQYPKSWKLAKAQVNPGTVGEYGTLLEAWELTNYAKESVAPGGALPMDAVKMDIQIMDFSTPGLKLEDLLDCGGKTLTCERVTISTHEYMRSTSTLNTGMKTISLATIYRENRIVIANALIQLGEKQGENATRVEDIINTFTLTE